MEEEHPALIWVIHIGKALGKQLPTPRDPPSSSSFLAHSSCLMSYATRVITTATEMKACNHISSMIFLPITPCTSAMLTLTPINRVKMIKIREHADLNQEDPISLVTDSSLSRDIAKQKRLLCCGPYKSLSLKMVLPSQWRVQCVKGCGAGQTFLERPSVFQCIILFWF